MHTMCVYIYMLRLKGVQCSLGTACCVCIYIYTYVCTYFQGYDLKMERAVGLGCRDSLPPDSELQALNPKT